MNVSTLTFLTGKNEIDAQNTANVVTQLAEGLNVYFQQPVMINKHRFPYQSEWSIIIKGTAENIEAFKKQAQRMVEVWKS